LRSALALQKVIPELQHQPVLSPAQLTLLREKTLALLSRFAELDSLEWIFTPSPSNPAELNLVWTQGAAGSLVAGQDPLKTPEQDDRFVTVAESPLGCLQEHQGHHQGHIQGLGVSPGVQVGQVYGLDTLQSNHHARDSAPIILVAQQLTPEIFPWLTEVHGLVLAEGGMTSHGAILARELEIPAVVGVGLANLPYLLSQSWLRVEGTAGWVEGLPADTPIAASHVGKISREVPGSEQHHINQHRIGLPPTPIRIFATINQVASLGSLPAYPVEGVGLLRSEWFGLDLWEGQHPHCWIAQGRQGELRQRLCDRLQSCIQAIQPRSLFYRSVDCRAAEFQSLRGQEVFPWTIGGAFAHCQDPRVLRLEFEILHQIDRGGSPVHLVLPMVRTVEEFIHCRDRYRQFLEEHILDPEKLAQKFPPDPFPPQHLPQEAFTPLSPEPLSLWVMVEVPSLLLQLPALAEAGVQGLVIGPGDLAHHFLGLDRERSGNLVHEVYHPLVHEVILKVLQEANQLPLPTLLCCAPETLPPEYLADYGQAGLWGITAEVPQLRAWGL
jgi:pyruvate, water dikinase